MITYVLLAALMLLIIAAVVRLTSRKDLVSLGNDNYGSLGVHQGARKTYLADAAISTRYSLVKAGSDLNHVAVVSSVLDIPLGICTDEPVDTASPVNVQCLCGADTTVRMVATGAITIGQPVVTYGDGTVAQLGTTAGMYWCVGYALTAATTTGDLIEVQPALFPIGVNVLT